MKIPDPNIEAPSKIHDCKKCHGKTVRIRVDKLGNSYCGYCNQQVNYYSYIKCPDCKSDDIDIMLGGCSIYPEMGTPTYCCKECRTIFAYKSETPQSTSI